MRTDFLVRKFLVYHRDGQTCFLIRDWGHGGQTQKKYGQGTLIRTRRHDRHRKKIDTHGIPDSNTRHDGHYFIILIHASLFFLLYGWTYTYLIKILRENKCISVHGENK